jgi:uncharacterized repeat protein (TIGR03803 family)
MPRQNFTRAARLSILTAFCFLIMVVASGAQIVSTLGTMAFTESNVIFDSAGNLYGTTQGGGGGNCASFGCGTVFELSPASGGTWTFTILYSFTGGTDGQAPAAGLVLDSGGNLYGTTQNGGGSAACADGCGTVFQLLPAGGGTWTETVLHRFSGGIDGSQPVAGLLLDSAGNLYGTAASGGASTAGVVFKLTHSSNGWNETVLHNFIGTDGQYPESALIRDSAGRLYGTTAQGGAHSAGVVYRLAPTSSGWRIALLHDFTGGSDGYLPVGTLTFDAAGSLYGSTQGGGNKKVNLGSGLVYRLSRSGNTWRETVLHTFTGGTDGGLPSAGVTFDAHGNLCGATYGGVPAGCDSFYGCGQIFQLNQSAGKWSLGNLYPIPAWNPSFGGLTRRGTAGNLFFTASDFHYFDFGAVYELTP